MQSHEKDNNTSDIIIIYFQTHKLKHFYHEMYCYVLIKTAMTRTHLGANVFQNILRSRVDIYYQVF